jgi:hypothetical protein
MMISHVYKTPIDDGRASKQASRNMTPEQIGLLREFLDLTIEQPPSQLWHMFQLKDDEFWNSVWCTHNFDACTVEFQDHKLLASRQIDSIDRTC